MRNRLFAVICVLLALAMLPGGASAKAKKAPKKDIGIQHLPSSITFPEKRRHKQKADQCRSYGNTRRNGYPQTMPRRLATIRMFPHITLHFVKETFGHTIGSFFSYIIKIKLFFHNLNYLVCTL